ncbi:phage tail protein [Pseudocitrobacter faecalis]|uniref:phage tail fiber protein n=1 Tax=Pseudocitrobacter faecalis TaxID=1398493 RepID=UPI0039EFAFAA
MIYNTGTISINGNTATGTGTNWTAAASQIRVSQTIIVLSNPVQMFQITAINSGTSLTVTPAASPALSGQKYGILVTDSLSVDGLAQSMSQLINEYDENIGAWETFASTSANQTITVTINGTSVTIPAIGGLARKGANSDITELKGLTTALSIAQGGTGAKTAADARSKLGLGSSSTYNVGSNLNEVLTVGVFGLGFSSNITGIYDYWDRTAFLSTTAQTEGFPGNGQGTMISVVHRNNTTYGSRWIGSADGRAFYQSKSNNSLSASYELCMIGKSVTVDSNGFIKKSSPVINLFADGRYETNEESEGCVVTRQGLGEYLIEGCSGLNSDAAWGGVDGGFELPVDRNKQPLIWLDYDVNADGSVLVKTYHRTNPGAPAFARNEIDGLADGDPVDIPSDQFVSVRVQMPACSIWNQKQEEAIDAMMKFEPEEPTYLQQD